MNAGPRGGGKTRKGKRERERERERGRGREGAKRMGRLLKFA